MYSGLFLLFENAHFLDSVQNSCNCSKILQLVTTVFALLCNTDIFWCYFLGVNVHFQVNTAQNDCVSFASHQTRCISVVLCTAC